MKHEYTIPPEIELMNQTKPSEPENDLFPTAVLWEDIIVDGISTYRKCTEEKRVYQEQRIDFNTIIDAYSWACNKQLDQDNISEPRYRFLLGIQCVLECAKALDLKNCKLIEIPSDRKTKEKLAKYHELSVTSINNYKNFATWILTISERNFDLAKAILDEKMIIVLHDTAELTAQPEQELDKLLAIIKHSNVQIKYSNILPDLGWRDIIDNNAVKRNIDKEPEIRKIPKYDPDVELAGLIFTLPSWLDSINRIYEVDLKKVSGKTKRELYEKILLLNKTTKKLMQELEN